MTKRNIMNLTQHDSSTEQIAEGVFEPDNKEKIKEILTFNTPPTHEEMFQRASQLVEIAREAKTEVAMIGGAPYFMGVLEDHLAKAGIQPLYAFTARDVVEREQDDGTIRKEMIFRHTGWVKAWVKEQYGL